MLSTKTEVRKAVGRGKFTVSDLAEAREVTVKSARANVARLLSEGAIERLDETQKNIDPESGKALRGRPAHLFRVVKGK